jgi:hypothetical protein
MNDVEERARHLIEAARAGHHPNAADAARVRAALKARVLAEPLLLQPGAAPAVGASGALGKVLIALAVGGSLGFAAGLYAAQAFWPGAPARPLEARAAERAAIATGASSAAATPDSAPAPDGADPAAEARARGLDAASVERGASMSHAATGRVKSPLPLPLRVPARATSSAAAASALPAVSPLKAELDGLRRAQELLYQGRPAWAIARLDELDRAGVGSVLLEERAATRAIAECRLGADGQRQADEYARRFPRSAHLERVRASCAGAPPVGTPLPGGEMSGAATPAAKATPTQTESQGSPHEE